MLVVKSFFSLKGFSFSFLVFFSTAAIPTINGSYNNYVNKNVYVSKQMNSLYLLCLLARGKKGQNYVYVVVEWTIYLPLSSL